ncbi:MAG: prepilin-type N-terminal cleavage/methylation domain-containing protein [candidate division NC10 bacterium]|nr:prepilin-type N-terminal cleavage/methylation domain-containing protein [candidate division NC10 bacterium]
MRRSRENFLALKEQRGVTAIEIFVVLVVIAIMAGAATPWILGAIQTYRVRAAAWELAGDLRLARQKAVSLQRGHRICFAACGSPVPTGAYLLERQDPTGWALDLTRNDIPNGVAVTSPANTLTYGTKGDGSGGTITLTNNIGTYVVVAAPSGRVRVCKGTICPP